MFYFIPNLVVPEYHLAWTILVVCLLLKKWLLISCLVKREGKERKKERIHFRS